MALDRAILNTYNLIPEVGPARLGKILSHPDIAWLWQRGQLPDYENLRLSRKIAEAIISSKAKIEPKAEWEKVIGAGITVLVREDSGYPQLLSEIPTPPPLLYIRGQTEHLNGLMLAVVGTRKVTPYGKQAAASLIPELAGHGFGIVSGLAMGVDSCALELALESGAKAAAVLATSLNDAAISPRSNLELAKRIIGQGCLISEYPIGAVVQKQNFPVRNRIIAGLSAGTLVIEADEESGSLITARLALEQNRAVMAVPGSIFSQASRGTNLLIKKGARLVATASDVLEELNLDLRAMNSPVNVRAGSREEESVLASLARTPKTLEDIILETKLPASEIRSAISMLEISGRVKNLGGSYVKLL